LLFITIITLYKKSNESDSLLPLFTKREKEQFALHPYCHSLQKEQCQRSAPASLYKKRERAICSLKRVKERFSLFAKNNEQLA